MQKILYVAAALLCSLACEVRGADLPTFRLTSSTGDSWAFPSESLTMKPVGDLLVVTSADGSSVSMDLNRLATAGFAADNNSSGLVTALRPDEPCTAYSISGVAAGSFGSVAEARASLAPGVYVLKTESATCKLILQ